MDEENEGWKDEKTPDLSAGRKFTRHVQYGSQATRKTCQKL